MSSTHSNVIKNLLINYNKLIMQIISAINNAINAK